jgi:hypothetical protein
MCIKKVYTREEVDRELNRLNEESPEKLWWAEACYECRGFHVCRGERDEAYT